MIWDSIKLGDACFVRRGTTITKKNAVEGDVPVIGGGTKPTYFHNEPNREAGCITISGSGASAGFVNRWDMPIFASDCSTVEPKDEMQLPKFVYYYLLSQQQFIYNNFRSGAAQPHVYAKDIETLDFPILPLLEQERIVAKLDAAFAKIDRGIKTTKAKESEISRLNTSILSTILTEHNHKIVKLGSIATVIAGQSPKGEYYNKEGRGTPFYQGKKDYGKRYLNEPKVWTDKVTKLAEKDDILLSVRAPIGALNIATQQICIGRGLAAIRPSTKILNDYLFYSLLLISNKLEGSSGAIFNSINKSQIEALEVTLPSIEEQQNILDKLDAALEKIKLTEYSSEAIIKNYIKLKSAILKQELQSSEAA